MWVLTEKVSDYNQHGDYLVCVYENKPTFEELMVVFGNKNLCNQLLENLAGGEEGDNSRYYLKEIKSGEVYNRH